MANGNSGNSPYKNVVTYGLLFLALIALYYLYGFLFGTSNILTVQLLNTRTDATTIDSAKIPAIPKPLEGGEYTVNTWIYISSFRNAGGAAVTQKKYVFELQGTTFDTLLIALGASVNKLIVRVNTKDQTSGSTPSDDISLKVTGSPSEVDGIMNAVSEPDTQICDIGEIDLQRWILVSVVLNGKTVDTYLDGKLARSCTLPHVYRVDSSTVKAVICRGGGFDGYINSTSVSNYALNPDEIYRMYSTGPTGGTWNPLSFITNIFTPSTSP
jgi:hypothetical protein